MGNKIKSFLSMALALLLVVTSLNIPAYASEMTDGDQQQGTVVAKIGDAEYESLDKALNAAVANDIINIVIDITVDGTCNYTVPTGVTINGGGNTLAVNEVGHYGNNALFYGETFSVENWTVKVEVGTNRPHAFHMVKGGNLSGVTVNGNFANGVWINGGDLSVTGCTFNNGKASGDYAIYYETSDLGNVVIANNTMNTPRAVALRDDEVFTGNTVTGEKGVSVATANATITGNTFTGARAMSISAEATISGNNISANSYVECTKPVDLSGNYWGGAAPSETQLKTEGDGNVTVDTYYTTADENGLGDLVDTNAPQPVYIATANGTGYDSLQKAIDAVENGGTVTLLKSTSGAGVVINKNVTIDFAGYTYTLTSGVGSTGTETNGFQILENNTVTLKKGTLNVAEDNKGDFYILVQNYADLTVENMTLDGTNLDRYSETDGDSYTLSNNSGTVNITGATNIIANNEGAKAFAFDVCKYANYEAPTVYVNTTGKITGPIEVSEEISTNLNISGGTFTVPVDEEWCADNFLPIKNSDGTYGVKPGSYIASVKDEEGNVTKYATLQEAIDAVDEGGIVTLLKTTSGAGVVIDKDVTINFGGYTYTFTSPVGSTGTITNGFQILENNTVTLKNGTLNVDEDNKGDFYILVQNYADLTVTNMTLDGTNLDKYSGTDGDSYTLSNNSGTVTINGKTNIKANDEGDKAFAFDVCKYANYEAPTVNVNTTGTITGAIEVSETISTNLNISGGTFTVPLKEDWCAEDFIPTENADGTYGVRPELPTATVTEISKEKLTAGDAPELTFALNFYANDYEYEYYDEWFADFVLTANKTATFNANPNTGSDGYLAGQYDNFDTGWLPVPDGDVVLKANEPFRIMAFAAEALEEPGLKFTYGMVKTFVKDFDCGIYFTPEFIAANPDLEVTLELRIYNNNNEEESYLIGESFEYYLPDASVTDSEGKVTEYKTLAEALAAAENGDTVTVLENVTSSEILTIDKAIKVNGNDKTITSTAGRAINIDVTGAVEINDLTIIGQSSCQRGINIINNKSDVTLNKVTVTGVSHYAVHTATSVPSGSTITMKDCDLTGWAAVAVYGDDMTVTITDSKLVGDATKYGKPNDSLSVISVGADNVTIKVTGGSMTANAVAGHEQDVFGSVKGSSTNVTAILDTELVFTGNGKTSIVGWIVEDDVTVAVRAEYAGKLAEEGYITETYNGEESLITVAARAVAKNNVTGTLYETVSAALLEAKSGETVLLMAEAEENYVLVTPGVTLDLNGYTLTAGYVVGFATANVVDNSEDNTGLLKIAKDNVVLDESNAQLPVWNAVDGYVFAAVRFASSLVATETGARFSFNHDIELHALEFLKTAGATDNNLSVIVRMSWTVTNALGEADVVTQDFAYSDTLVSIVAQSNTGASSTDYGEMYTLDITGIDGITDLKVAPMIISGTGVEKTRSAKTLPQN